MDGTSFDHVFIPRSGATGTLLLLHGTGGNEHDLIPLGERLAPRASLLSPRGKILENGKPRFFRRLAEGVFDVADLKMRANELGTWVTNAVQKYGAPPPLIAVGFSNGANIAAGMLMQSSTRLDAAVLLRAMVPYEPDAPLDVAGVRILLSQGETDPTVPPEQSERLASMFRAGGASVELEWQHAGHALAGNDIDAAKRFIGSILSSH
jgi:predicted esterase